MKKLTQNKLNKILDQHKLWLDTSWEEGKKANFTNMNVSGLDFSGRDLRRAIFVEAYCYEANFTNADCYEANFTNADCWYANFSEADCEDANFSKANCCYANFSEAYCYEANFAEAGCWRADFSKANCRYANFSKADCGGANFLDTKLSKCTGNNREIRSLRLDPYTVTIHENIMAIGCEQHTIKEWFGFDDERIRVMADGALEWWKKCGSFVKNYIDLSQELSDR